MKTNMKFIASTALMISFVGCGKKDETTVIAASPVQSPTPAPQQMPQQLPQPVQLPPPVAIVPPVSVQLPMPSAAPVAVPVVQKLANVGAYSINLSEMQDLIVATYSKGVVFADFSSEFYKLADNGHCENSFPELASFVSSVPTLYCKTSAWTDAFSSMLRGQRLAANSIQLKTKPELAAGNPNNQKSIIINGFDSSIRFGSLASKFSEACNKNPDGMGIQILRSTPILATGITISDVKKARLSTCTTQDGTESWRVAGALIVDNEFFATTDLRTWDQKISQNRKVLEIVYMERTNGVNGGENLATAMEQTMIRILHKNTAN